MTKMGIVNKDEVCSAIYCHFWNCRFVTWCRYSHLLALTGPSPTRQPLWEHHRNLAQETAGQAVNDTSVIYVNQRKVFTTFNHSNLSNTLCAAWIGTGTWRRSVGNKSTFVEKTAPFIANLWIKKSSVMLYAGHTRFSTDVAVTMLRAPQFRNMTTWTRMRKSRALSSKKEGGGFGLAPVWKTNFFSLCHANGLSCKVST